jgi:hypothetical protein
MYQRFDGSILPKEDLSNTLMRLVDHTSSLNDHARLLEKRIREIRSMLEKDTIEISNNDTDSSKHQVEQQPNAADTVQLSSLPWIDPNISTSNDESSSQQASTSLVFALSKKSNDIFLFERLTFELNSIALDWRSYHSSVNCKCALPFDSLQRKV